MTSRCQLAGEEATTVSEFLRECVDRVLMPMEDRNRIFY